MCLSSLQEGICFAWQRFGARGMSELDNVYQ